MTEKTFQHNVHCPQCGKPMGYVDYDRKYPQVVVPPFEIYGTTGLENPYACKTCQKVWDVSWIRSNSQDPWQVDSICSGSEDDEEQPILYENLHW